MLALVVALVLHAADASLASHAGEPPAALFEASKSHLNSQHRQLEKTGHLRPKSELDSKLISRFFIPAAYAADDPQSSNAGKLDGSKSRSISSKVTGFVAQLSDQLRSSQILTTVQSNLAAMPAHPSFAILSGAAMSGAVITIANRRASPHQGGGLFRRKRAPPPPPDDDDWLNRGGNLTNWILDIESRFLNKLRLPLVLSARQMRAIQLLVPCAVAALSGLNILILASHDGLLLQASCPPAPALQHLAGLFDPF